MESPAPASAPPTRAESMVARDMPTAPMSSPGGMVSPMSEFRITRSLGRKIPLSPATRNTHPGPSTSVKASSISSAARVA